MARNDANFDEIFDEVNAPDVYKVLRAFIKSGANDLRLAVDAPPYVTKNGITTPLEGFPKMDKDKLSKALFSLVSSDQWEKFLVQWRLDASFRLPGEARFRLNYFYEKDQPSAVLRLINDTAPTIQELGLPGVVADIMKNPRGLVLITGQTGSGKTTSATALIEKMNKERRCSIHTVEDPIEFQYANDQAFITQREVGADTKSYNFALLDLLRQAPDIAFIGELREPETIKSALILAENCLVVSTLHTASAASTIDRILITFDAHERQQIRASLSATLKAIICQCLILDKQGERRYGAFEVMQVTKEIQEALRDPSGTKTLPSLIARTKDIGNILMDNSIHNLVKAGKIDVAAALSKANNRALLERALEKGQNNG